MHAVLAVEGNHPVLPDPRVLKIRAYCPESGIARDQHHVLDQHDVPGRTQSFMRYSPLRASRQACMP